MPDPSAFLSTIAATSAAMVAIVGGLLVARFVTIASEQEGAQQLLDDAEGRLGIARRREGDAQDNLRNSNIAHFFDAEVIQTIGNGDRSISKLRSVGGNTPLTDPEIAEAAQTIADEFTVARDALEKLLPPASAIQKIKDLSWNRFKQAGLEAGLTFPKTDWDAVWKITYEEMVRPQQSAATSTLGSTGLSTPYSFTPSLQGYSALDVQRRDALRANLTRAEQHVEDLEDEVARLQRARNAIVRPKGLGWGLIVLVFFTFVGVLIPIWLMSRAPQQLTAHFGEVVFWLFFAGLLTLFIYMGALALRLSGWRRTSPSEVEQADATAGAAANTAP